MFLLDANLTARTKSALRSSASEFVRFIQAVRFTITTLVIRYTLGITAAPERIRRTLQTLRGLLVRVVSAVVLVVAHHGLPDAVSVTATERPLVTSVRLTVLTLLVRSVQTIVDSVAQPVPQDALSVIAPVFVLVAIAVFFV